MLPTEGSLLRIFVGEADKHDKQPLYEWIVAQARAQGLAGATVLRGLMGFGANTRVIHTFKIERLSEETFRLLSNSSTHRTSWRRSSRSLTGTFTRGSWPQWSRFKFAFIAGLNRPNLRRFPSKALPKDAVVREITTHSRAVG